jgi:hypothetical protein
MPQYITVNSAGSSDPELAEGERARENVELSSFGNYFIHV